MKVERKKVDRKLCLWWLLGDEEEMERRAKEPSDERERDGGWEDERDRTDYQLSGW